MIKELNEFAKELKLYRTSNTLPQGDVKNKLADIYEANFKVKWGLRKVDRGCPSCISDMMKCLCAEWFDSLKDFKGVPLDKESPSNSDIFLNELYNSIDNEKKQDASTVKEYKEDNLPESISYDEDRESLKRMSDSVQRDLEDQIAEEEGTMPSDYHDLDTAGLIDLCDTLGIKYHHKNKKATLIKKLDKYFND
jgi:hypothetical protein